MQSESEQKSEFYRLLEEAIGDLAPTKRETFSLNQDKYDRAVSALQQAKGAKCTDGAHFKFWCNKNFKLQKIGSRMVLYCLKTSCPVITKEDIFDTIKRLVKITCIAFISH